MARPPIPPGESGEISVREVRPGKFQADAHVRREDGHRTRVRVVRSSRAAAVRALKERIHERTTVWDSASLSASATVEQAVTAWLEWAAEQGELRPQSLDRYRVSAYRHVIPALGPLRLHELRTSALEGALRGMSPGVAPGAKKVLANTLRHARRLGVMTHDPLADVRLPRRERKDPTTVPVDRIPALRARVADEGTADLLGILDILIMTGLRSGEVLALRAVDITFPAEDDEDKTVVVAVTGTVVEVKGVGMVRQPLTKSRSGKRRIGLPRGSRAEQFLAEKVATAEDPTGPLWPARGGGWMYQSTFNKWLRAALAGTEFEGTTVHTIRRTVASALSRERTTRVAADLLGHSDPAITSGYYIALPEVVQAWEGPTG